MNRLILNSSPKASFLALCLSLIFISMSHLMAISLSVKPVVKKYLVYHHGSSSIYLKRKSSSFKMISTNTTADSYRKIFIDKYPEQVRFILSAQYIKEGRDPRYHFLYFDHDAIIALNQYYLKRLKIELNIYLDAYLIHGSEIRLGILSFMEKFNITEDDLSYEALKKSYYRYRERHKMLKAC